MKDYKDSKMALSNVFWYYEENGIVEKTLSDVDVWKRNKKEYEDAYEKVADALKEDKALLGKMIHHFYMMAAAEREVCYRFGLRDAMYLCRETFLTDCICGEE